MNRFFGIEKFFSGIAEKGHQIKEGVSVISTAISLQRMIEEAEKTGTQDSVQVQQKIMQKGMATIWKLGQFEIEKITRNVCEKILKDPSVEKKIREKRARGLKIIGDLFLKIGKSKKNTPTIQDFLGSQPEQMEKTPERRHSESTQNKPPQTQERRSSQPEPHHYTQPTPPSQSNPLPTHPSGKERYTEEELLKLSSKELKAIMIEKGMDPSLYFEKSEIIAAILKSQ